MSGASFTRAKPACITRPSCPPQKNPGRAELPPSIYASTTHASHLERKMASPAEELFFESHNEDKSETIVLLHGLLSSHKEWDLVIPHLGAYHVLAVDLNGHSGSRNMTPTTTTASAENVATLIRGRAKGGTAHVVGLSFGGFVGLSLTGAHPELVRSLFVSGAAPFEGLYKWMAERPSTIWYSLRAIMGVPEWLYWRMLSWKGMAKNEALYADMLGNLKWENVRDGYTSILDIAFEDVARMDVRILSVAGDQDDDLKSTRKMGECIR
ncbi:alpha/beta fold hydrolase, partial [Candidatus Bathyarchaeota archaeon]|nr:alpha/beta fold hydrolase [Candidatus Bathyarchaeota archaeon]